MAAFSAADWYKDNGDPVVRLVFHDQPDYILVGVKHSEWNKVYWDHIKHEDKQRRELMKGITKEDASHPKFRERLNELLASQHTDRQFDSIRALLSANPQRPLKITRKANKRAGLSAKTVTILAEHLFTCDGEFRPLAEVFTEALQKKVEHKDTFQPSQYPWRLCLELEEPGAEDSSSGVGGRERPWFLRFLLQASNDPAIRVTFEQARRFTIVRERGTKTLRYACDELNKRGRFDIEKYDTVLRDAALKLPLLQQWFNEGKPERLQQTLDQAVEFLQNAAPQWADAGFGILLPKWCTGERERQKLSRWVRFREAAGANAGALTLDSVVRVDWDLALGEDRLTDEELSEIARLKSPLVQLRGKWVYLSAEELQAASKLILARVTEEVPMRDALQLAICGSDEKVLEVKDMAAFDGFEQLLARLQARQSLPDVSVPQGLSGILRPYQQRGLSWLAFMSDLGLGACLADDMGLGKTIQALALLQHRSENGGTDQCLLVCPTSVIGNWRNEARRFTPRLHLYVHHGDARLAKPGEFFHRARNYALVITSYSLLARDVEILRSVPWSGIILDEAQNIKNPDSKQAQAAKRLSSQWRVALTGTPVENSVRDLWSIMDFLNPGFFGTWGRFEKRFFLPIQRERDPDAIARLARMVEPFLFRRVKTDRSIIADLPEKLEMKVFCTLTKQQATDYEAVLRTEMDKVAQVDGIQRRGIILSLLIKLKQVCNHPLLLYQDRSEVAERSGKLTRLTEMLEEVRSRGERALVFTQYAEMGKILQRHLSEVLGEEVLFLHGGVSAPDRDRMVERFQAAQDQPAVFVLSLRAGGIGLNLTRANHVFHYDRWWNPAVENQATDRAHRIGQANAVQVHKLLCLGTCEEKIDQMIESKKEITERIVGTGESWLTEISTSDLRQLLELDDEARQLALAQE